MSAIPVMPQETTFTLDELGRFMLSRSFDVYSTGARLLFFNRTLTAIDARNFFKYIRTMQYLYQSGVQVYTTVQEINCRKLELNFLRFETGVIEVLTEELAANPQITSLLFDTRQTNPSEIKALAEILTVNKHITSLSFRSSDLNLEKCNALFEALDKNHTITTLALMSDSLPLKGIEALIKWLRTNNTLTTLNLSIRVDGPEGTKASTRDATLALASMLKTNNTISTFTMIEDLDVEDVKVLAEALETNNTLTTLSLRKNDFGFGCRKIQILLKALENNNSLRTLDLRDNNINTKEIEDLIELLRANTTITTKIIILDILNQPNSFLCPYQNVITELYERNIALRKVKSNWASVALDIASLRANAENPLKYGCKPLFDTILSFAAMEKSRVFPDKATATTTATTVNGNPIPKAEKPSF